MKRFSVSWDYIASFIDAEGCISYIPYNQVDKRNNRYYGIRCQVYVGQKLEQSYVIDLISKKLNDSGINNCVTVDRKIGKNRTCRMKYLRVQNHNCILKLFKFIIPRLIVKQDIAKEMEDTILAKNWQKWGELNIDWNNTKEKSNYNRKYLERKRRYKHE